MVVAPLRALARPCSMLIVSASPQLELRSASGLFLMYRMKEGLAIAACAATGRQSERATASARAQRAGRGPAGSGMTGSPRRHTTARHADDRRAAAKTKVLQSLMQSCER